ncbi:MAG: prolyl oligopeptidase family serine peptidase [Bacteroides sp.]|nr:prolyl oligopeptidase family serine peptidase [Bacteroides sp.]
MRKYSCMIMLLLLFGIGEAFSQKSPMKLDDCKQWRSIDQIHLSADGKWVVYNFRALYRQDVDTTYMYNVRTKKTLRKVGLSNFSYMANGKLLKYERKGEGDNSGRPLVYTLNLATQKERQWPKNVFLVPITGTDMAYYVRYKPNGKIDFTFVNLLTEEEKCITDINNFGQVEANKLLYTVADSLSSTLYLWEKGKQTEIGEVPCYITSISSPDTNGRGTLSCASSYETRSDASSIYTFDLNKHLCTKLLSYEDISGLPEGTKVSSSSRLINNNTQLLVDLEPAVYPQVETEPRPVNLELWIWDENISPRRPFKRTGFDASSYDKYIYDIIDKKCFALPTKGLSSLAFPQGQNVKGCIAFDATPWYKESDWKMSPNNDVYYIGLNGNKEKLASHGKYDLVWSPDESSALLYDPALRAWRLINMITGSVQNLTTGKLPYPVYEEDHDYSFDASAYGVAGWNLPDQTVTVYDRYDLWNLDLKGKKAPVCLTQGIGRKEHIIFRKAENPSSLPGKLYLEGFDEKSKTKGLYVLQGKKLRMVAVDPQSNLVVKASTTNNAVVLWMKENYGERNFWIADLTLRNPERVTDTNPQTRNLNWGTTQLYTWTNFEGKKNEGILYLPEDYQKGKSYPVIVLLYEKMSQKLNSYLLPEYSSATIDIPWFVSNGYIIFCPDISYRIGAPYESCYNAVMSGVEKLIKDGIADKDRVGINGHSWGGSQTAYLVTRTNLFKCASPCSAVTDLVADYLMLRGTGQPNMYFEEDAQGRLGKALWEDKQLYLDNSPIMHADKIHTPLLIFHGEQDTSVRIYQGLALYFAMRRLGRPAWLLNYRDVGHQMGNEPDCRDFMQRLIDFFDHYLKGSPMPEWMKGDQSDK